MTKNIVVVDTKTRFVTVSNPLIGNKGENRVTRLYVNMSEFLDGSAFLEIRRPDPNDITQSISQYAQMDKEENGYSIVVLNSILQVVGKIELCLHIYNSSMFEGGCACEIFKSSIFEMIVGDTIDAEDDEIEEYPDVFGKLLAKIDSAIADIKVINEIIASGSLEGKVVKDIVYNEKDSVPNVIDIYTILYTDGTSSSLSIKYGEQYDDSGLKKEIAEIKINYVKKDELASLETDPTVPIWAKQPEKPTYTATEVGALPKETTIPKNTTDLTNDSMVQYTVQTLNDAQKKQARKNIGAGTSDFSGSYNDLNDKPDIVTQLTSTATDDELVSAKCLYNIIGNVETQLASI